MTPGDVPLWIVLSFLFVFGCTVGSFLNVCVHRLPLHDRLRDQLRSLTSPPSRCPKCLQQIQPRDNIPIIGWLLLRGKCRNCGLPISIRYPLVELFNGLLWVLLYWMEVPAGFRAGLEDSSLYVSKFGPQIFEGFSPTLHVNLRFAYHLILVEAILVASLIDWDLKIIPDGSTVPAMLVGLIGAGAVGYLQLVPVWFQSPLFAGAVGDLLPESWRVTLPPNGVPEWIVEHPHWHGLAVSVAGFLIGGGLIWGVRILGQWVLKREAMGFGDVVLMAMIGSFIGWQPVVIVFFLAPLFALAAVVISLFFRRQKEIPFGPYLSLATLAVLLFFREIWPIWEPFFQAGLLLPIMAVVGAILLAGSLALMQVVKRLLGISTHEDREEWVEEWTSADQLSYQSSENHDASQGRWKLEQWPGCHAGQGTLQQQNWKQSPSPGWKTVQQRVR